MTDYIKAGVELADGWRHEGGNCLCMPFDAGLWAYADLEQCHLDSLATQLVRQVDALRPRDPEIDRQCILGIWAESVSLIDFSEFPHKETLIEFDDADRTMNTIEAIVDSGVLND